MLQILLILHVLVCIALITLVLLQQGKGADIGAAFGSGASQTVFGSQGSTSFLTKLISLLAAIFFVMSLTLAYLTAKFEKAPTIVLPTSGQTTNGNTGNSLPNSQQ